MLASLPLPFHTTFPNFVPAPLLHPFQKDTVIEMHSLSTHWDRVDSWKCTKWDIGKPIVALSDTIRNNSPTLNKRDSHNHWVAIINVLSTDYLSILSNAMLTLPSGKQVRSFQLEKYKHLPHRNGFPLGKFKQPVLDICIPYCKSRMGAMVVMQLLTSNW